MTEILFTDIFSPSTTEKLTSTAPPEGVGLIPSIVALGFPHPSILGTNLIYSLFVGSHWTFAFSEMPFITASSVTLSFTAIFNLSTSTPSSAFLICIILSLLVTTTLSFSTFANELSFKVPFIVALPAACALIFPLSSTVTTDESSESHTISAFFAFSGVKRTLIAYSSPIIISILS